jgi:hypothetical protein
MNSKYEILKTLLKDPKINWLRADYCGRAKYGLAAWFREQTGETTDHIKKSHFLSDRLVSSRSTSLLLTMTRDTGSRNEDGEYDFRSLIISYLDPDTLKEKINVPEIWIAENFQSYNPVNWKGLPVFPQPADDAVFAANLLNLRRLEILKDKMSSKMSGLKNRLDKDGIVEQLGKKLSWKKPEGNSETILDSTGLEVKKTPTPSVGFQLHPTIAPEVKFDTKAYTLANIVQFWNEIEEIGKKIKTMMNSLRPYELGIMERLTDTDSPFMIGGIEFKVEKLKSAIYDWTPEDRKKVESKEYKIGQIPKSKGRWLCEVISPPSTEKVEQKNMVTV